MKFERICKCGRRCNPHTFKESAEINIACSSKCFFKTKRITRVRLQVNLFLADNSKGWAFALAYEVFGQRLKTTWRLHILRAIKIGVSHEIQKTNSKRTCILSSIQDATSLSDFSGTGFEKQSTFFKDIRFPETFANVILKAIKKWNDFYRVPVNWELQTVHNCWNLGTYRKCLQETRRIQKNFPKFHLSTHKMFERPTI